MNHDHTFISGPPRHYRFPVGHGRDPVGIAGARRARHLHLRPGT